ncbi:hypothetical protein ERX35_007050 [Macrococcus equipercicus]|uniref:Uncharacterized protein n=1 Tax=Macrococcus equipercicus TaxID=69967 RepID=A0ABQ6R886_9STAP|nr:hypothetical protein [Macrococcus equipercicus]KAA1039322.1 hypothetical protein ERX35_007050 [Macrococcus equipercicus]
MAEENYEGLETERNQLTNETITTDQEEAALVNDSLGVAPDAGVEELDPDPLMDNEMIAEDDE